jgi:sarcosine oxidase subunit beta
MTETADVIVVGGGVQGASLAFHLARRGVRVTVLERDAIGAAATGRSSGFVRTHYDLGTECELAWKSLPWFEDWAGHVGAGDCGFVRTGFVQLIPPQLAGHLRANVAMQQEIGIETRVINGADVARLVPGASVDDVTAAAWEPRSGYADPYGTAAGFLAAARRDGARVLTGRRVSAVVVEGERVAGVDTDAGRLAAPVVVDVAGAWAGDVARSVGLRLPVQPWRHATAFFGLPEGRQADFPIVIDEINGVYFRPEGTEMMLVGLETGNELGGIPDRPLTAVPSAEIESMIDQLCRRLPWMVHGTLRTAHGGQDGMTPDQRAILGAAGPDGFYLVCGFSGTGFKTAPAVGACMTELILDGRATTVDISAYGLDRFAAGRLLVGEHPYGNLWR